jgi:hypothetical protein
MQQPYSSINIGTMKIKEIATETSQRNIWYHGTRSRAKHFKFKPGFFFMAAKKSKAAEYENRILSVVVNPGPALTIPYEKVTTNSLNKARKNGFRYVDFVANRSLYRVSLYPAQDLTLAK